MGEIDHEIAGKVAALQADITSSLQELEGLPEDHPRYEALFAQVVRAGSALLEYEAEVPVKLEAPQREVSKNALTWATRAHAVGGVLLAITPFTGWISWGWVVAAFVQLLVSFVLSGITPAPGKHRLLRYAAVILTVVTVLVPLLAFGVLPGLVGVVPVLGWGLSFAMTHDAGLAGGKATP